MNVSYAPDVFGGQRRLIETQAALADYQRFQLEATYLTLTSNVVTAAVQEASLRGQIDATNDIIKSEIDQLKVVHDQFDAGAASRTDVLTQQSEVANAQATLPPLQKQLEQQRHVMLALIGRFPNDARERSLTLASLRLPTDLPLSLPSQLVEQRPDVRSAQAQLHQASAQIGVAIANRLPQFTLTGSYGSAAVTTAALFTPGTRSSGARWRAARSRFSMALRCCINSAPPKLLTTKPQAQYRSTVLSGIPECRRRAAGAAARRPRVESAARRVARGVR